MDKNQNLFGLIISVFVSAFFFWFAFFFLAGEWVDRSNFLSYFKLFSVLLSLVIVAYFLFKVFSPSSNKYSKLSFSMKRVFRFIDVLIAGSMVLLFLFFIGAGPVGIIGVIFLPFLVAPVVAYIIIRIVSVIFWKL